MNLLSKRKLYQDTLFSKDFFCNSYGYQHLSTKHDEETGKVDIVFVNKVIERETEFCYTIQCKNDVHDLIGLNNP
ncbi:MAG: hypothetical protein IKW77_02390 [Salinivirgaceae bacterium]|nr:hypothetical protein [Salinivirgaceae bacterium]